MLTAPECGWSAYMERIRKAQEMRDDSMTSCMASKMTVEVNPTHTIMSELRKKATADESDKTVKDPLWLLFDTSLPTTGFNLDEPTQIEGRKPGGEHISFKEYVGSMQEGRTTSTASRVRASHPWRRRLSW